MCQYIFLYIVVSNCPFSSHSLFFCLEKVGTIMSILFIHYFPALLVVLLCVWWRYSTKYRETTKVSHSITFFVYERENIMKELKMWKCMWIGAQQKLWPTSNCFFSMIWVNSIESSLRKCLKSVVYFHFFLSMRTNNNNASCVKWSVESIEWRRRFWKEMWKKGGKRIWLELRGKNERREETGDMFVNE